MARIQRECRQRDLPRFRKPVEILFPDGDIPRPILHLNIVKDNIRECKFLQKRSDIVREVLFSQEREVASAFTSATHVVVGTTRTTICICTHTLQRNTRAVSLPPKRETKTSERKDEQWGRFRLQYDRNELPVRLVHGGPGEKAKALRWLIDPRTLQPEHIAALIPIFASGLPLIDEPYRFLAERGLNDLLDLDFHPALIIHSLPHLVRAFRAGLYSFDVEKKKEILRLIQRVTRRDACGPALTPYYRQFLPPLRSIGHSGLRLDIRYTSSRPLEEVIEKTLNELERTGGNNAYINIKYIIPTYTSITGAR